MEFFASPIGYMAFGVTAMLFAFFSRYSALGALSLPSITLLTSLVYFYLMPSLSFAGGNVGFFGVYIDSMDKIHLAVFLYTLGVSAACIIGFRLLKEQPALIRPYERPLNRTRFWIIAGVAGSGILALTFTSRLNLTGSEEFTVNENFGDFAFLQLALSMLLPLSIVYAVRENYNSRAKVVICLTVYILLISGFRFRIAILMIAVAASYSILRARRLGVVAVTLGTVVSILLFNMLGSVRRYGVGLDLNDFDGMNWMELLRSFGGEEGPVYALFSVIEYPQPELILADPWIIALARFIPSFVWPDKPFPAYLYYYTSAFEENIRSSAGIAGPQQAEILLQFGWPGLLLVPFGYFLLILWVMRRLTLLSREARIAGASLVPGVFGFYMQQRGYFFQNISEALFMLAPLFLMHSERTLENARHKASIYIDHR